MKQLTSAIKPVLVAFVWVAGNEFLRNQVVLQSKWVEHYSSLGLTFPSKPLNGAVWALWSLIFAKLVYMLTRKYSTKMAAAMAWVFGFLLMWLSLGNLLVLPGSILFLAVPWSMLEAYGAALICKKLAK